MVAAGASSSSIRVCAAPATTTMQVERGKPAPDIFLLAAARLGAAPERCVVFEVVEGASTHDVPRKDLVS